MTLRSRQKVCGNTANTLTHSTQEKNPINNDHKSKHLSLSPVKRINRNGRTYNGKLRSSSGHNPINLTLNQNPKQIEKVDCALKVTDKSLKSVW